VVITIDDDWKSTYDVAFPVLKKFGYPAALFVYTDLIARGASALNWQQLTEMSLHGIDIQSHSKSHRYLNRREGQESFRAYFEAVRRELSKSAEIIRMRLKKEVKYLSYPFGDTNSLVIALLDKLGYRGAFTVKRELIPSLPIITGSGVP